MGDVGKETPKALLKVLGKTLLEHKLDELPYSIDEVILVVGHLKEKIIELLGDGYNRLKINYVEQKELLGTAHALWMCKDKLWDEKKFLIMMGDDIYAPEDMKECMNEPWSVLVSERDSILGRAKVVFDELGKIENIVEKSTHDEPGFVCTGMYSLTPEIFNYEMVSIGGGEFGLPQTILSAKKDHEVKVVQAKFWLQVNAPEDLEIAEQYFNIKK